MEMLERWLFGTAAGLIVGLYVAVTVFGAIWCGNVMYGLAIRFGLDQFWAGGLSVAAGIVWLFTFTVGGLTALKD